MAEVFQVRMPDGRRLKAMNRAKIVRGFKGGKIPLGSVVVSARGDTVEISEFCNAKAAIKGVLIVANTNRSIIRVPEAPDIKLLPPLPRLKESGVSALLIIAIILISVSFGYLLPRLPILNQERALASNKKASGKANANPIGDDTPLLPPNHQRLDDPGQDGVKKENAEVEPVSEPEPVAVQPKRPLTDEEKLQALADQISERLGSRLALESYRGPPGELENTVVDDRSFIQSDLNGPTFIAKIRRPAFDVESITIAKSQNRSQGHYFGGNSGSDQSDKYVQAVFRTMEDMHGVKSTSSQSELHRNWVERYLAPSNDPWTLRVRLFGNVLTTLERTATRGYSAELNQIVVRYVTDQKERDAAESINAKIFSGVKLKLNECRSWPQIQRATRGIAGFDVQPQIPRAVLRQIFVGDSMIAVAERLSSLGEVTFSGAGIEVVEWMEDGRVAAKITFEQPR